MTNLWLFDIDGTLVDINHAHLNAYKISYKEIMNVEPPDELILSTFGMTEKEMHKTVFEKMDLVYDENLVNKIVDMGTTKLKNYIEPNKIKPLDGVLEFLNQLRENNEVLGVVTGNLEDVARLILEKSDLIEFFSVFSFDDGSLARSEIVKNAIDKVEHFDKVIVIGDTVNDIEAGKANSALTVGVATGSCSFEELKDADCVVKSLKDYKEILKSLNY